MTPNEKLELLEAKAKGFQNRYPDWREGQALYNTLFLDCRFIADQIRGTEYDCFNDDNKINAFKARVIELWSK